MKEMESFSFWKQIQNIQKCNLPFAKHWSGQNSLLEASIEWINLGCFRGVVLSTRIFMCKKSTVNNTTPLSSQGLTLLHTKKESNNSRFWTKLSGQCHEASDASGKKTSSSVVPDVLPLPETLPRYYYASRNYRVRFYSTGQAGRKDKHHTPPKTKQNRPTPIPSNSSPICLQL